MVLRTGNRAFSRGFVTRFAFALGLLCTTGCAGFQSERHLAPLFTQLSPAGGGQEIEALGGIVRVRTSPETGRVNEWAIRPLYSHWIESNNDTRSYFFVPLGRSSRTKRRSLWQLLPIARWQYTIDDEGRSEWSWLSLPGIYWQKSNDGYIRRAWFPFGGVFEHFLSVDRGEFWLFPLYAKTERAGRTTYHFLFPIFSYTHGRGGTSGRFWPLIGRKRYKGRYDRWFFLWPIFHYQHNDTSYAPENQERSYGVMPLYGWSHRGRSRSYTWLWPFFGYTKNPDKEFWAWDGPWPFVVFQEPGTSGQGTRHRVWPFYSNYEGDGLRSRYYLWPLINVRHEEYNGTTKDSLLVLPFWQSWERRNRTEGTTTFRKLWPIYQREKGEDSELFAFPALNPLWRTPIIDYHYAWAYELFTRRVKGDQISDRSWLGLWRRETDKNEDRRSFSGVWARRRYSSEGERVTETSYLFGLLRFRRRTGSGLEMLRPAFPGPGWPLERVPNSLPN